MNENGKLSVWYSWPVIFIVLCLFWPIGIYLIIKRISVDKQTAMGSSRLIGGLGIASYSIAGLAFIACISDGFTSDDVVGILFFVAAGYVLRRVSKKTKDEAEDVKKYLAIIVNGNVRQLDSVASSVGKTYDTVKADVQNLINKGYLKNAYINETTREVVMQHANTANYTTTQNVSSGTTSTPKVVSCKCCGANNTIFGKTGECEYCGAPLSSDQ